VFASSLSFRYRLVLASESPEVPSEIFSSCPVDLCESLHVAKATRLPSSSSVVSSVRHFVFSLDRLMRIYPFSSDPPCVRPPNSSRRFTNRRRCRLIKRFSESLYLEFISPQPVRCQSFKWRAIMNTCIRSLFRAGRPQFVKAGRKRCLNSSPSICRRYAPPATSTFVPTPTESLQCVGPSFGTRSNGGNRHGHRSQRTFQSRCHGPLGRELSILPSQGSREATTIAADDRF